MLENRAMTDRGRLGKNNLTFAYSGNIVCCTKKTDRKQNNFLICVSLRTGKGAGLKESTINHILGLLAEKWRVHHKKAHYRQGWGRRKVTGSLVWPPHCWTYSDSRQNSKRGDSWLSRKVTNRLTINAYYMCNRVTISLFKFGT